MTPRLVLHVTTTTLCAAFYISHPSIAGCALGVLTLVLLYLTTNGEHRRLETERQERNAILRASVSAASLAASISHSASSARSVR